MPRNNMTLRIGGEAGQGVESGAMGLAKTLARGGLHVFGLNDYMSRIRGGYNFMHMRVNEDPVYTHIDPIHLIIAFNTEAAESHLADIPAGGGVIYDQGLRKLDTSTWADRQVQAFPMPLDSIARDIGGSPIMLNTAAIAGALGITNYDFKQLAEVITQNFARKGQKIVDNNIKVAETAYEFGQKNYAGAFDWELSPVDAPPRMVINGNQAISMGAIAGGCRFISAYPMTPGTSVLEYLTAKANEFGIVTKQTEDELAAILFAIGASHAGVRSMTTTSGGGFCLMVEALGLAGTTETPVVIVLAQRGGPSTGLPTRTEQPDLEFAIHASHGEFPRIILTPGTIEQCFEAGHRAHNLAEKYQLPVIIMTDLYQATSFRTVELDALDFAGVNIERGKTLMPEDVGELANGYYRYALSDDGISPRMVPGHEKGVYVAVGDEHHEDGSITEDSQPRNEQMRKRMQKLETALPEIHPPEYYGADESEITLVGWGSTRGALVESVDRLNSYGIRASMIHYSEIWPFPVEATERLLERCRTTIAVEQNYTGQLANVIREQTGHKVDRRINKYDGRQISPDEIVSSVRIGVALNV